MVDHPQRFFLRASMIVDNVLRSEAEDSELLSGFAERSLLHRASPRQNSLPNCIASTRIKNLVIRAFFTCFHPGSTCQLLCLSLRPWLPICSKQLLQVAQVAALKALFVPAVLIFLEQHIAFTSVADFEHPHS